jgi:hypothetical protein
MYAAVCSIQRLAGMQLPSAGGWEAGGRRPDKGGGWQVVVTKMMMLVDFLVWNLC